MDNTMSRVNPELHIVNESKNGCLEYGPDIAFGLEFNRAANTLNSTLQAFLCGSGCPGKSERFDPGRPGIIFA